VSAFGLASNSAHQNLCLFHVPTDTHFLHQECSQHTSFVSGVAWLLVILSVSTTLHTSTCVRHSCGARADGLRADCARRKNGRLSGPRACVPPVTAGAAHLCCRPTFWIDYDNRAFGTRNNTTLFAPRHTRSHISPRCALVPTCTYIVVPLWARAFHSFFVRRTLGASVRRTCRWSQASIAHSRGFRLIRACGLIREPAARVLHPPILCHRFCRSL